MENLQARQHYFADKQRIERKQIQHIFDNFFRHHACSFLTLTDTDTFERIDFYFLSADTVNVFGEYKRREISSRKYNDGIVESVKFKNLYTLHKAGNATFFVVEYDDFIFIYDLKHEFEAYRLVDENDECFFSLLNATGDCFEYEQGGREKAVRYLPHYHTLFIIDKRNFQPVTYREYTGG